MEGKQRIISFDFAKGMLMLFVVYWHAIHELMHEGSLFDQGMVFTIYSFHMPLFIFISGCFAWKKCHGKLADMIKANTQRLLVPGLLAATACYFASHSGGEL